MTPNIELITADITKIPVDVIVNAANKMLLRGGGVCGAIHKAAGSELEEECLKIRDEKYPKGLPIGDVVVTGAYKLPAKRVFHTVGPRNGVDDINLLKNCYINCISLAEEMGLESISFPAISTGIYGVPIEFSADIVREVLNNLSEMKNLKIINFIFFKESDRELYQERLF